MRRFEYHPSCGLRFSRIHLRHGIICETAGLYCTLAERKQEREAESMVQLAFARFYGSDAADGQRTDDISAVRLSGALGLAVSILHICALASISNWLLLLHIVPHFINMKEIHAPIFQN